MITKLAVILSAVQVRRPLKRLVQFPRKPRRAVSGRSQCKSPEVGTSAGGKPSSADMYLEARPRFGPAVLRLDRRSSGERRGRGPKSAFVYVLGAS
jgi:hypothetical protein